MIQLNKLLEIFEAEINQLIATEKKQRKFRLIESSQKGDLTQIFPNVGKKELEELHNNQVIIVIYNRTEILEVYLKSNFTDEILINIFKYLAHHEYGHSLFCKSTCTMKNSLENYINTHFKDYENQEYLFSKLFQILREFYADVQAERTYSHIPMEILDFRFILFKTLLKLNTLGSFFQFLYDVLFFSTPFYIFNQWHYIVENCGENNKTETLKLILLINKIIEKMIRRALDLEGYFSLIEQLTHLLWEIDYEILLKENHIEPDYIHKLEDLL